MTAPYILSALAFGIVALVFLWNRPHWAVTLMAVGLFGLAPVFQADAGKPAMADARLASEQWRLLSVAPLSDGVFLVSVRYQVGDVRTYSLHLETPEQRDAFLKAAQALKKGHVLNGRAARGRAGLESDDLGFSFSEAPDSNPKPPSN